MVYGNLNAKIIEVSFTIWCFLRLRRNGLSPSIYLLSFVMSGFAPILSVSVAAAGPNFFGVATKESGVGSVDILSSR